MKLAAVDLITALLVVVILAAALAISALRSKRHGPLEWDPRPPNARERTIAGIWLVGFVPASVNYFAGWRLFGGYDNWVFAAFFLGGILLIHFLPGVTHTK